MMNDDYFHAHVKDLYFPPAKQFTVIDIPELRYVMVEGQGSPENVDLSSIMKWLYGLVHATKPHIIKTLGKMPGYPPPEFLFWADNPQDFVEGNKEKWRWKVMLVCAEFVTADIIDTAKQEVEKKNGPLSFPIYIDHLREGKCVQYLHVGDYGGVAKVCEKLYGEYLPRHKLAPAGYYHEVYLNDPTRAMPKKRKILIRQPVK